MSTFFLYVHYDPEACLYHLLNPNTQPDSNGLFDHASHLHTKHFLFSQLLDYIDEVYFDEHIDLVPTVSTIDYLVEDLSSWYFKPDMSTMYREIEGIPFIYDTYHRSTKRGQLTLDLEPCPNHYVLNNFINLTQRRVS